MAARTVTALDDDALRELIEQLGDKPFRARQLQHWVYRHGVTAFDQCHNLPPALRAQLADWGSVQGSTVQRAEQADDGTEKLLVQLADSEIVECVIIPDGARTTLCISSQVGCPVACVFCASGLDGVRRNLTAGEIVEQVLHARRRLPADRPLTNIVVMGMGEPMLNLDQLLPALARIGDEAGIGLGARRITVSTSGYPDRIARLAETPQQYGLAISLHAADDALRRRLVPTARASVAEIVAAATAYGRQKSREVTFEIVLLAGINDRDRDAHALIDLLRGSRCTVNLIPWNPVNEIDHLQRPAPHIIEAFAERLRDGRLNVTVRRQRGADRNAACGQLRVRQNQHKSQ